MEAGAQMEKRMDELKGMEEKQEARVNYHETRLHNFIAADFAGGLGLILFAIFKKNSPNISTLISHGSLWVILAFACLIKFGVLVVLGDAGFMLYHAENQLILILQHYDQLCQKLLMIKQQAHTQDSSMEAGGQSGLGLSLEEELILVNSSSAYRRSPGKIKCKLLAIFCVLVGLISVELWVWMFVLFN